MNLSQDMYEALALRYRAIIAESKATINIYFANPVGIGEHPQHLEEIDKLCEKIAGAEDKMSVPQRHFDQYAKI